MKKFFKERGITLIALVVTVIVMLILAGVTLNLIAGGDGILGRAETAVNETEKQTATEKINFKITSKQIDSYAENGRNATLKELAEFLADDKEEIQYVLPKSQAKASLDWWGENDNFSSIFTKLIEYPYEFEIDSNLRLASVDGVKIADSSSNSSITEEQISAIIDQKLSDYAKQTDLENLQSSVQNDYATKTELSNYATKDSLTNIERTVLWSKGIEFAVNSDPNVNITLSDISSYKYIEFQYDFYSTFWNGYSGAKTSFIAVDQIVYNDSDTLDGSDGSVVSFLNYYDINFYGYFKNKTTFRIAHADSSDENASRIRIRKICGIK